MIINLTPQEKQRVKDLALMFHSRMAIIDNVRVILPYDKWFYEQQEEWTE